MNKYYTEKASGFPSNKNDKNCKHDPRVSYLHTPTKSENDKKEYRVIKLKNGLTALLISDLKSIEIPERNLINSTKSEFEMKNRLSACALCVNVGSFSDPLKAQGLAHLIEHVIFMGSRKYPEENEYEKFIKEKGGFVHADTSNEKTTYLFQIHPDYLFPAIDRFANFFIEPLFKRNNILRERESIDNEFYMDLSSDYERLKQLFRIIPNDNHPASKFSCGNLISLRDNVDENTLCSMLQLFKARHYSANRMTLAVQANFSLDILEKYVKDIFCNIPSNYLPPDNFTKFSSVDSFNTSVFKKFYKIKSINDTCEMELKWIMPPSINLYKTKPLHYISQLIDREGKGSLSYYFRQNGICHRVNVSHEQNSIYSVLKLNLILPSVSNTCIKQTLDTVFSYMKILRRDGAHKRIFDEIKRIADIKFKFAEELNSVINVRSLSFNMHLYPPSDYITGNHLYFEHEPESIQKFLDCLTPENVFIVLIDKNFNEAEFKSVETWYKIKYSSTEIPNEWIIRWNEIEPFSEFQLPESNPFLATNFDLIDLPKFVSNYPTKIQDDNKIELWYKPDSKYRLPICYAYLHLISDVSMQSVNSHIMLRLYEIFLNELVLKDLYEAKCAGLSYNILKSDRGIIVKVNGFSQKISILLITIIKYITEFGTLITKDMFLLVKTELMKYYSNALNDPVIFANEIHSSVLEPNFRMSTDKRNIVSGIKFNELLEFSKQLTKIIYIRCLVQGNMSKSSAIKIINETVKPLHFNTSLPNKLLKFNYHQLTLGEKYCRVENLNPLDVNTVVINHYQTDIEYCKLCSPVLKEFFEMIIQEPMFYQLRTQEQLCYDVNCSSNVKGFNITISSPAHKFTMEYLDERIENFLEQFKNKIKYMLKDDFNIRKKYFKNLKKCGDINLKDETEKNWFAINYKNSVFNMKMQEILIINDLTIKEFHQWVDYHFKNGKYFRKLSVQVKGNAILFDDAVL